MADLLANLKSFFIKKEGYWYEIHDTLDEIEDLDLFENKSAFL